MDLKDYVKMELDGLERGFNRALKGLTQDEVAWRPGSGCNSIGLILFHAARSEDSFIQARLRDKPEVWKTGKWAKKLNLSEDEAGSRYTADQVNCFAVPRLEDLLAFYAAVRAQTVAHLKTMAAADFDKKITMPHFGEMPVASIFSIIAGHTSQHIGEISYLRGLQRGVDK